MSEEDAVLLALIVVNLIIIALMAGAFIFKVFL